MSATATQWIVVNSNDRRMVFNEHAGWVDRDIEPGPTIFSDAYRKAIALEPRTAGSRTATCASSRS